MPSRLYPFTTGYYYHVFNRGVEKRQIFINDSDYRRFLETVYYYQFNGPKPRLSTYKRFKIKDFENNPKIVEIICYCLMPNHFHLLIKQLEDDGIQKFISNVANSYTKYFNTKHTRVGHLFQGQTKSVFIESDEQLIHLSRYIHLNPYTSEITKDWSNFPYSSYQEFSPYRQTVLCNTDPILELFPSNEKYFEFIKDYEGYALDIAHFKHILIDED